MQGQSYTIPFPSGGWNARDPFDAMPETDAIEMINIIPRGNYGESRKGMALHKVFAGIGDYTETLIGFKSSSGSEYLIGAFYNNDTSNYRIANLTSTSSKTDLETGLTNGRWQHTVFKQVLIMVNGEDQPQQFNGASMTDATYTGIGNDALLVDVTGYKERLYFVEIDSTSFWYGSTGAITGALTEFDVGEFLTRGGTLEWVSSMSAATGSGLEDFLVLMSSEGEVLIYSGDDPGAGTWALVGRYYVGKPLGRRAKEHIGPDLVFLTREGALSMRNVMAGSNAGGTYPHYTDKIQNAYRDLVDSYGSLFGWDIQHWTQGNLAVILAPTGEGFLNGNPILLVINTQTGAWSKWTGPQVLCMTVFQNNLFFGADDYLTIFKYSGHIDRNPVGTSSVALAGKLRTAFNYIGDRARNKFARQVELVLQGDSSVRFGLGIDTDLNQAAYPTATSITGSTGDSYLSKLYTAAAYGKNFSVKMQGNFTDAPYKINSMRIIYEPSGEVL